MNRPRILFAALAAALLWPGIAPARADVQSIAFPEIGFPREVAPGVKVQFRVEPKLDLQVEGLGADATLHLAGDLTDLQAKLPQILAASLKPPAPDSCGDTVAVSNPTLQPTSPAALLKGKVHYERWFCTPGTGARTRLLSTDANMCVTLTPRITEEGGLRIEPAITCVEGGGIAGQALGLLQGTVNSTLTSSLMQAIGEDKLTLFVPEALRPFDPKFQEVRLVDRGNGQLGMEAVGTFRVGLVQAATLLEQLMRQQ